MNYRAASIGIALGAHFSFGCGADDTETTTTPDATTETTPSNSVGTASVLGFHNHLNRDGLYIDPALTRASAASMHRDTTFDGTVHGNVYTQPLYVQNGPNAAGTFYVATEDNDVVALDEAHGLPLWRANMGTPATQAGAGTGCGNISPIGITGTPAIDPATRLLVLSAATADAAGNVATHTIHALSIDDGSERWHVDMTTLTDQLGRHFSPRPQNSRSAVLIVAGVAYVAYGGIAYDCGDFHGSLVGIPLAHPENTKLYAASVQGAGMWAPGGPSSDGTSIFAVTGNATESVTSWGGSEAALRFDPGPTLSNQTADFFVPANWSTTLDQHDWDLGGSGLLVVDAPSMTPHTLVVAQGKDGLVYLLDRANLGGIAGAPVGTQRVINGAFIGAGAFATIGTSTYLVLKGFRGSTGLTCPAGTAGDLIVLRLDPTASNAIVTAWCADNQGEGAPIVTTSDGTADAIVWTAGAENSGQLHGWDLATGAVVFSGAVASDAIPNLRRYTTIVDVHGRLYAAADGKLYAFTP